MGKPKMTASEQLANRVQRDEQGCLIWQGPTYNKRYGRILHEGKDDLVHRVAYELAYGEIPAGMYVCHHCDVPLCVEPTHLFLGTPQDNMTDKVTKKRHKSPKGSDHGMSVLTDEDVLKIFNDPRDNTQISEDYLVSRPMISMIKSGKRWSHITGKEYTKVQEKKKLSDGEVLLIFNDPRSRQDIAEDFGVSQTTVTYIKNGNRHSKITGKIS